MLYVYLALLMGAMYWVVKTLGPEMAKPPLPRPGPRPEPLELDELDIRAEKLETILVEKNKRINILQTELKSLYVQVRDFDKIKSLLEEEIRRLREQNRIFRSELGLSTSLPKETSIS